MKDKDFIDIFPDSIPVVPHVPPNPSPTPTRDDWSGGRDHIHEEAPSPPTMEREESWGPPPEMPK